MCSCQNSALVGVPWVFVQMPLLPQQSIYSNPGIHFVDHHLRSTSPSTESWRHSCEWNRSHYELSHLGNRPVEVHLPGCISCLKFPKKIYSQLAFNPALAVISMSWELSAWSQTMNLNDTSTTSPHYCFRKRIGIWILILGLNGLRTKFNKKGVALKQTPRFGPCRFHCSPSTFKSSLTRFQRARGHRVTITGTGHCKTRGLYLDWRGVSFRLTHSTMTCSSPPPPGIPVVMV